jgi:hypothetical protein
VGAEEGHLVGELGGQAQRALLVGDAEAVAALDLDGRRAERPHLGDPGPQQGAQLVVARGSRGADGHPDPAAVVGRARHPRGELTRPVPRVDEVAVAVDEPGDDRSAADVEPTVGRGGVDRAPHPLDDSVDDDHRGIPKETESLRHRRGGIHGDRAVGSGAGDELTDAGDEHGVGCRALPPSRVGESHVCWSAQTAWCLLSTGRGWLGGHRRTAAIASCSNEPTSPRRC